MRTSKLSAAIGLACCFYASASSAGTLTQIHNGSVTHIVTSTGNIYWTEHILNEIQPSTARIMRAEKTAKPGESRVLYSELSNTNQPFGRLVYAHLDTWYGYFIANDESGSAVNYSSSIKRIPLAGGEAKLIKTLPRYVGKRSLRTDGSYLYWADNGGIRRMSMNGGQITTLASTTEANRLEIDANYVYYTDGNIIRRVLKTGGLLEAVAAAKDPINTFYVYPANGGTRILYADNVGGVYGRDVGGHTVTWYKDPAANDHIYGVGFDGTRVLWTYCNDNNYTNKTVCNLAVRTGSSTAYHAASISAGNMDNLQWDDDHVYWASSHGIQKFKH